MCYHASGSNLGGEGKWTKVSRFSPLLTASASRHGGIRWRSVERCTRFRDASIFLIHFVPIFYGQTAPKDSASECTEYEPWPCRYWVASALTHTHTQNPTAWRNGYVEIYWRWTQSWLSYGDHRFSLCSPPPPLNSLTRSLHFRQQGVPNLTVIVCSPLSGSWLGGQRWGGEA